MYEGWLTLGEGDPFTGINQQELINNARAQQYAVNAGICWLNECSECPGANLLLPGGGDFQSPILDPAPWYDVNNPDTWGFLGVIGLEVIGDESSTRNVQVNNALVQGGVIGPPYFSYRTLAVRGIAIAEDECALQAGLNWLEFRTANMQDPCVGDTLTFYDCCPCACPEFLEDPEADETCLEDCIRPYLRHYNNVAITSGPTVINHPAMHSRGAMAEFEMILVAADPVKYSAPAAARITIMATGAVPHDDPLATVPLPDPFDVPGTTMAKIAATVQLGRTKVVFDPLPNSWFRDTAVWGEDPDGSTLSSIRPLISVETGAAAAEHVRLGVWDGPEFMGGWEIPFIPANTTIVIDGHRRSVVAIRAGGTRELTGFVKDYVGGPVKWPDFPEALYTITVDQEVGHAVPLTVVAGSVSGLR